MQVAVVLFSVLALTVHVLCAPLCHHSDGVWQRYRTISQKQIINSTYRKTVSKFPHLLCSKKRDYSPSLEYKWVPTDPACVFPTYETFPSYVPVFRNKTLYFLGDSISQEQFRSLAYLLGCEAGEGEQCKTCVLSDPVPDKDDRLPYNVHRESSCFSIPALNTTLLYSREDVFSNPDAKDLNNFEYISPMSTIVDFANSKQVDVFILNTGPHRTAPLWLTMHRAASVMETLHTHFQGSHILFRSNVPGHYNCAQHTRPHCENPNPLDWHAWNEFEPKNTIWKNAIHLYHTPGTLFYDPRIQFFDTTKISACRPDAHSKPGGIDPEEGSHDCLHYCLPGPIDNWNFALALALAHNATTPTPTPTPALR